MHIAPHTALRTRVAAALCAVALVACNAPSEPAPSPVDRAPAVLVEGPGGLVNTLTLSATQLARGDTLRIGSSVTNEGTAPVAAETRICGLDVEAADGFRAPDPWGRCGGYSQGGDIGPGEVRVSSESILVGGAPGLYTLRVRHLLRPELWVTATVEVR